MNFALYSSTLYQFLSHEDAQLVLLAYRLSKKIHRGQYRKAEGGAQGERYFNHPRRVSLSFVDYGFTDPKHLIGALLHDAVEDSDEQILVSTLCDKLFGLEVATDIRFVSKFPKEGYIERITKAWHEGRHRPALIKFFDRYDNLKTLPAWEPAFCAKQLKETREKYLDLFAEVAKKYPQLSAPFEEMREMCYA